MAAHKIDIVIPCFNYAGFLDECLEAVTAQTRTDFSVLIMDNASEDDTPAVAQRWMARDERIRYHRNEENLGAVANMKLGYELGSADLVAILPADDLWQPNFLERTCEALEAHPECSYAYTGWHANSGSRHDQERDMSWVPHTGSGVVDDLVYLTIQNFIPLSFGVFRRAMCEKAGGAYPLFLPMLGDLYLWMRLAVEGPGYYVHENLGRLRIHGGNESNALHATGRSAHDHIHLLDLIFESERWPLPLRLLGKARQIQLMTGRSLCEVISSFGNAGTLPMIQDFVEPARADLHRMAADAVRCWAGHAVGMSDTLAEAEALCPGDDAVLGSAGTERYLKWRSRRTLQEIDGQLLAERMMHGWRFRPKFTLAVEVSAGQEAALADTIDSLAAQWYPEWTLVVFAHALDAPEELRGIDQVRWIGLEAGRGRCHHGAALEAGDADFVAVLPVGTTLDEHALQLVADHVNASPAWLALYTDDDIVDAGGNLRHRLKPDFNPELFYASDYIGPACFICREALRAFAEAAAEPSPSPYGLLLRLYEQTGAATIGHLADPLVHLPGEPLPDPDALALVSAHLARRGPDASVEEGWFVGTRRVRYRGGAADLVSVVVMSADQAGFLRTALRSLVDTSGHASVEVILVDHASTDPDALALIAEACAGGFGVPVRRLRVEGEFWPARFRNQAAALARGSYLLFADDDLEFFQPDWLAQLLGAARHSGAAVLAPRLVDNAHGKPKIAAAAEVMGLNGLAGSMAPAGTDLMNGGYQLRYQLDQEASSVSGHCLLVEKAHFEALGGFSERCPDAQHGALDLCLRTRATGRRVLWLATVDVIHHGGPTLRRRMLSKPFQADWIGRLHVERRDMLDRHLPAMARDPFYNRNLSLFEPFNPDTEVLIDWDPRFHDRLRILGIPLTSGAGEYRMASPFRALGKAGLAQCCLVHPVRHNLQRVLSPIELARAQPDVFVMQSAIDDAQLVSLTEIQHHNTGQLKILTLDDRLGDMPREHPIYAFHALEGKSRLRRAAMLCDRMVVSTEHLRDYCADMIEDIRVVPNMLERDTWCTLAPRRNEGRRPRVGWVGAMQHKADLRLIEPVMKALANDVDWVLMGMCPDFLRPYVKESHPFVSIQDYPAKMATLALDLALAPLEIHPFNESKSNLRLLEYGALGWPVVCTDITPYRSNSPPVLRLANDPQRWIAAIRERIADRDALRAEGAALKAWVEASYILDDRLDLWMAALSPAGPASADGPAAARAD